MNSNKQIKIKELVELINGYGFGTSDWEREGTPIIRIQNLNNSKAEYNYTKKVVSEKYVVNKGDILIAWAGSLGVYEWEQETEALLNQHLYKVKFKSNEIDKSYFKYLMEQALLELSAKARGVGLKHLKKEQLDNYEFTLPQIDEQKKVILFLNKIENLIKKRKQTITLLSDYIENIFLELFLENPNLTNNPEYWGTIGDVVDESIYGISQKSNDEGKGYPILRMNNITYSGEFLLKDIKWIEMDKEEMEKYELKNGDVLFNRTNSKELVGKTAVWNGPKGYVFAGYLVKIILNKDKMNSNYFSGYMNSSFGKKILFSKGKSSGNLVNFSPPLLKAQKILIPPLESQEKYEKIVLKTKEYKTSLKKSLNLLKELRRSVINDVLKGKNEIDDLDNLINDDIQLELFLNTINKSDYSNEEQYDFDIKRLYSIIERTEKRNKENPEYLKGIIQRIENDEIIIETNKEYKYRLSDEAAKN